MPELDPSGIRATPGSPYITPPMLIAANTGILWDSIPSLTGQATAQQQWDAQLDVCTKATAMINGYANQVLRCTIDTETLFGPGDFRFQMRPNGSARLLLARTPVTSVISGQVSPASQFPESWTPVPATGFKIEVPVIGVYGTTSPSAAGDGGPAVLLAPGYVSWLGGRLGWEVQVTYTNGWPHGSTQQASSPGDTVLHVDDCTGWGPPSGATTGAAGTLHDPGTQESFTVTAASATSGPGTLTLSSALGYPHPAGTLATTLPGTVIEAAILFAVSIALVGGATATTQQAIPGVAATGGKTSAEYAAEAELLIHPYRRIWLPNSCDGCSQGARCR